MNIEQLINIYNILRQISVRGDDVKLMHSCLVGFEEIFQSIQQMQQEAASAPATE